MKILLNPSDPVDELGEIRKVWFEMNKRIKKKLRKRFGRFHYRESMTVIIFNKCNGNFKILDKIILPKPPSGMSDIMINGVNISQHLREHFSEIKDVDLCENI